MLSRVCAFKYIKASLFHAPHVRGLMTLCEVAESMIVGESECIAQLIGCMEFSNAELLARALFPMHFSETESEMSAASSGTRGWCTSLNSILRKFTTNWVNITSSHLTLIHDSHANSLMFTSFRINMNRLKHSQKTKNTIIQTKRLSAAHRPISFRWMVR